MTDETMKILVVEPEKQPYTMGIDGSLESMQAVVKGYIEMLSPYRDNVVLVCNEEGKLDGLPENRLLRDQRGVPYDVICGTFFLVGMGEEDCCSLTEQQIDRYTKAFYIGMHKHKKSPSHEER